MFYFTNKTSSGITCLRQNFQHFVTNSFVFRIVIHSFRLKTSVNIEQELVHKLEWVAKINIEIFGKRKLFWITFWPAFAYPRVCKKSVSSIWSAPLAERTLWHLYIIWNLNRAGQCNWLNAHTPFGVSSSIRLKSKISFFLHFALELSKIYFLRLWYVHKICATRIEPAENIWVY